MKPQKFVVATGTPHKINWLQRNNTMDSRFCEPIKNDPAWQDQRLLVLLFAGLLLALIHLWQWPLPGCLGRRVATPSGGRFAWLAAGGTLPQGIYLLSPAVTVADLYRRSGLAMPAAPVADGPAEGKKAEPTGDHASPVANEMANEARPLFFQPIAVNRADRELLITVPGIGPVLADRIVRLREERGGFHRPEDLLEVKGIGPVKLARFRPYLDFEK